MINGLLFCPSSGDEMLNAIEGTQHADNKLSTVGQSRSGAAVTASIATVGNKLAGDLI